MAGTWDLFEERDTYGADVGADCNVLLGGDSVQTATEAS
jgi:hypothetical protein